ncbi:UvrD-helicase domain-containing protein [Spongiactinospora sp. TRM90649]|uniref:UvrD-helicase domain-containing protein n=1 Tax=Spongiactinospora sp. TRM90649 TaxID=3031114 RepID=UPI0023F6495E|nr:UvrD-helicase domain-containing protein [Spongiactinospora sp. TRM90649]MDF5756549.1 UvrD-helicase domain-containing protein [Spongiactinospora sp. TRM90649]
MPSPTVEQTRIMEDFVAGKALRVQAGAGAGKTTTLKMAAAATPRRKGLYVAFNKVIATEAAASFPESVSCRTGHSLAYAAVGRTYARRLKAPRMSSHLVACKMGINEPVRLDEGRVLAPAQVARVVMATVANFTHSDRRDIAHQPVARLRGWEDDDAMEALEQVVPPLALRAWADLTNPRGGLPFSHDTYFKIWSLADPQLAADFVMVDEFQDTNPALLSVIRAQRSAQIVAVGDSAQAIYEWRGAIDAMNAIDGVERTLSQSFRFGEAVAEEANKWLEILDAPLRLRGFEAINSRVAELEEPDAILCRTNAEAMAQAMAGLDKGKRVALVGGGRQIRAMAEAALQLQEGRGCDHPELCAFQNWGQVQQYAFVEEDGQDLQAMVKLIDGHGAEKIIDVADALDREEAADLIISTAHRSKGREWHRVRVAGDFSEPKPTDDGRPGKVTPADARLAYVTVTRAQHVLDTGGLSWVDKYLA